MSIKLLHPDARSLVKQRFDSLKKAATAADKISTMSHGEKLLHRIPIDFDANAAIVRKGRDNYHELLSNLNFWSASTFEPCALTMNYDGTKDLFGQKILGIILLYKNVFYSVSGPYEIKEAKLILLDSLRKKKRKAEYLVAREDIPESELAYERQSILEEVKHEVWRRDKGRCVRCGSVRNLEYDHMIPVSLGGANTTRNIQLLCESCNRRKSNNIG